jgi:hypothetical protein
MSRDDLDHAVARLSRALSLYACGLALKRDQILRAHPDLDRHELERRLLAWLRTRPGAAR